MIKVKRIDHVAVAVGDRDAAARSLTGAVRAERRRARDGRRTDDGRRVPARRAIAAGDETALEICAPAGDAALERFLDRARSGASPRLLRGRRPWRRARHAQGGGRPPDRRDAAPGRARPHGRLPPPGRDRGRAVRAVRTGRTTGVRSVSAPSTIHAARARRGDAGPRAGGVRADGTGRFRRPGRHAAAARRPAPVRKRKKGRPRRRPKRRTARATSNP